MLLAAACTPCFGMEGVELSGLCMDLSLAILDRNVSACVHGSPWGEYPHTNIQDDLISHLFKRQLALSPDSKIFVLEVGSFSGGSATKFVTVAKQQNFSKVWRGEASPLGGHVPGAGRVPGANGSQAKVWGIGKDFVICIPPQLNMCPSVSQPNNEG